MTYSKTHERLADYAEIELDQVKDFLGPNWKDVLNFWLYLDDLTEETKDKILKFDKNFIHAAHQTYIETYLELTGSIVGMTESDCIWEAAYNPLCSTAWYCASATYELICSHVILKRGMDLLFFPLFVPEPKKMIFLSTPNRPDNGELLCLKIKNWARDLWATPKTYYPPGSGF
jgi:hypothetical protein